MPHNHQNLLLAFNYLHQVIDGRLSAYFSKRKRKKQGYQLPEFDLPPADDFFTRFVAHYEFSIEEFIVLLCALVPHVIPNFYERAIAKHLPGDGSFPEFGGYKSVDVRYMLPTVNTALFILAGDDIAHRLELLNLFDSGHFFAQEGILQLGDTKTSEPFLSKTILLDEEYIELFTKGRISIPRLSAEFPAELLHTKMEWEDLVLDANTRQQLNTIELWLRHNETVLTDWGLSKQVKPGFRALFFGPPGTGKTLAASLIAKSSNRPVFRVDLSKVVSKYIGETEKNLAKLFDRAENKDWILFFDEADACFGKRSTTKDAKDRYANQEVSYLLQRIESYAGLIIMATNFRKNIDEAFVRRFNTVAYFPKPKPEERLQLWKKALPTNIPLASSINLSELATKYELTGAHIINAIHYACLHSADQSAKELSGESLIKGISRELAKEGRRA